MGGIWAGLWSELRRYRWTVAGLVMLVGIFGGTAIASGAGARRTDSAFPRFLRDIASPDLIVPNIPDPSGTNALFPADVVRKLPGVKLVEESRPGHVHGRRRRPHDRQRTARVRCGPRRSPARQDLPVQDALGPTPGSNEDRRGCRRLCGGATTACSRWRADPIRAHPSARGRVQATRRQDSRDASHRWA